MNALSVISTLEAQPRFASAPKTNHQPIKPLYNWAGGKTKLVHKHYQGKMPSYSGFTSYIEPFFGGGAVFCDVVNSNKIDQFVINDINPEIVSIYRTIKADVEAFIVHCIVLADEWNAKPSDERKAWYYGLRKQYWDMKASTLTAATLYVLMKTSFNGVWQPSKENAGKFGTAAGLLDKEAKIDPDLIRAWSAKLQNTTITSTDYRDIEIPMNPCLIYCDPPYRGSFTSYGQDFNDQAQMDLVEWCRSMSAKGHTVVLANRDCNDGFFDEILADATAIHNFDVKYTVGRKKKTDDGYEATEAKEFIAIFEGQEIQAANEDDFHEVSFNLGAPEIRAEILSSEKYRDIFPVRLFHFIQRIADRPRRGMSPTRPGYTTKWNAPEIWINKNATQGETI